MSPPESPRQSPSVASSTLLPLLLDSTGEGIYGIDTEGHCTFVNRATAEMLGRSPESMLGQNMHRLMHHSHADGRHYPHEDCPIFKAFRQGESCRIDSEVMWRADGSAFPVEYSSCPIVVDGQVQGAVVTVVDITVRKQAELQLQRSHEQLTRSNAELSQALVNLQRAQAQLVASEKLASLGRLVAGIAHELNTPLGNSLTVVSSLEDRFAALDRMLSNNEPMRRSLLVELVRDTRHGQDILQRNVQRAANLVRDFKQVSLDQTTDLRRDFDLAQVIEDMMVMVEPSYNHTPFVIDAELECGLLMNSFPGSLGQVLTNLLMNALVHGFEGRESGRVLVRCRRLDAETVELAVSDDGRGMEESVRRRIFDPFFTTKLGTGGSGLGMHIVHSIVLNVLGGQIEVRSSPGQGAAMVIQLPVVAPVRTVDAAQ